ncbi:MAG: DNA/RNA non-specific endonuclease [Lachnospiraceae bacterium]|nr:DNA/RNA non-specific endonuclease [Lachnospiraceae bacterium]
MIISITVIVLALALLFVPRLLLRRELQNRVPRLSEENTQGSKSTVDADPASIPDYVGQDTITLNNGIPNFNEWDFENIQGEHFSPLDRLGRCGVAYAMLDYTMMPKEPRGEITGVKPTGYRQKKYPGIVPSDPPFLYNRCHLIAYALTGQNANELNLITGTRHMNTILMLPFEEEVIHYLNDSNDHILYRVTPYFKDLELVARGVEIEACSVEDRGRSLRIHVFVYNVQPSVLIDYSTGDSRANF